MFTSHKLKTAIAAVTLAVAGVTFNTLMKTAEAAKPVSEPPAYVVTDLGPWWGSYPELINEPGLNNPDGDGILQIAGASLDQSGNWSATRWCADEMTGAVLDLQPLVGGLARAVNDAGYVVGVTGGPIAFVDVPGVGAVLLPGLGGGAHATGINNAGDIVGFYFGSAQRHQGILWHVDAEGNVTGPVDLGAFVPKDVNDWGLMAGYWNTQGSPDVAAIAWLENGAFNFQDLPGLVARAQAVNNLGEVAGYSSNGREFRATMWDPVTGTIADLGPGRAHDINDHGQVVGWHYVRRKNWTGYTGFLWEDGRMVDVNTLAGTAGALFQASRINNAGHIVGGMWTDEGFRACLLTPIP